MVLATLAPSERTGLLRGMSDEGAAACLATMSLNARGGVLADLTAADPTLATCALAFIWYNSNLCSLKWWTARRCLEMGCLTTGTTGAIHVGSGFHNHNTSSGMQDSSKGVLKY